MGDASEITDRERKIRIAALSELKYSPRCVWNQPVCPWDYNPTSKKKSKKSSWAVDLHAGRNYKGNNFDTRKKQVCNQTPREKKKLQKKSFSYYHDIGDYIKEYRELTKAISSDHKTCLCHGGYTQKDVEKMYEALPKIKKRDPKRAKAPAAKVDTSSSVAIVDKVKDEVEDEEARATPLQFANPPPNLTQRNLLKDGISRQVFKQGNAEGLEDFVQQHVGRDFFMHPCIGKKGTSCPVIKIMLPEAHDVRRVSRCGTESPQKLISMDSPALMHPIIRHTNISQASDDTKEQRFSRTGLFEAVSPNDFQNTLSPSLFHTTDSSKKVKTLSAKVRDFRPFSRNGIATRVSKVMKDKQRQRALSDPNVPTNNFTKQEIPWKVLRYLGYNPSMRKYLHDIYSPIEYKQSKSPLGISSKKCFKPEKDPATVPENRPSHYPSIFPKPHDIGVSHLLAGDIRDKKDSNILVEKYLRIHRQERPKLAILPKLDTVVKPKVMKKFILS